MNRVSFALLAFSLFLLNNPAVAQGEVSPEKSGMPMSQSESVTKGTNPDDQPDIKSGINVYVITLENLRETGMAINKVKQAASDLYEEVTQREVTLTTTPNVVGPTVLNMPTGFSTGNYLPPRKRWVDAHMQDMATTVKLMKGEIDDVLNGKEQLLVPPSTRDSVKELFDQWVKLVTDVYAKLGELEKVTAKPNLNNAEIMKGATAIHNDMKQLEAARKKVYKLLQKAAAKKEEATATL